VGQLMHPSAVQAENRHLAQLYLSNNSGPVDSTKVGHEDLEAAEIFEIGERRAVSWPKKSAPKQAPATRMPPPSRSRFHVR
jgi:hypothetical protein